MPKKETGNSKKKLNIVLIICAIAVACAFLALKLSNKVTAGKDNRTKLSHNLIKGDKDKGVVDYNKLKKDKNLKALMQKRKAEYGIKNGVDMVVKSDESVRVGNETVSMEHIMDQVRLKSGEILEKNIGKDDLKTKNKPEDFGVYVVHPGDNIWNIHFKLLKDYFDRKQISLSPLADEPDSKGRSSGVGKILKFSEHMVYIYNMKDRTLSDNIHTINPLSKIVVYRMGEVFSLLDSINYKNVNHIQFDGETLWMPPEQ